jgi:DNA-binding NarL/FixJ family response regulator
MIAEHRMVCEAVQRILEEEGDTCWLGWETDLQTGLQYVRNCPLDVLLVETDAPFELFADLLQNAEDHIPRRVLAFSLRDNQLHVVSYEQREILSTRDFLDALLGFPEREKRPEGLL